MLYVSELAVCCFLISYLTARYGGLLTVFRTCFLELSVLSGPFFKAIPRVEMILYVLFYLCLVVA